MADYERISKLGAKSDEALEAILETDFLSHSRVFTDRVQAAAIQVAGKVISASLKTTQPKTPAEGATNSDPARATALLAYQILKEFDALIRAGFHPA